MEYIAEASKTLKEPVLAILEREIQGCCSTKIVNQIMLVNREDIPDLNAFKVVEKDGWFIFLDNKIANHEDKIIIDFTGLSSIRRLIVSGIPIKTQNSSCC